MFVIMNNHSIHMIGNAHLDPAWLWRWQEGFSEIKATFQSALDRMNEFEEFTFTASSASLYEWIEENSPTMFREIKVRVKEGRWIIAGGMWVQPDCNIPGGESFVRHTLYSQGYFYEKFGIIARTGFNVDSFGHNSSLPQILSKSGMTAYIYMRPDIKENPNLEEGVFQWFSADGSSVTVFRIPTHYGPFWEASQRGNEEEQKIHKSMEISENTGLPVLNLYGVGNHGGGPTIENIKMILRMCEQFPKAGIQFSSPDNLISYVEPEQLLPFKGELQHHARACYSANSEVKQLNRKSEERLITAEKISTLAYHLFNSTSDAPELKRAWKRVLFNQFHDILAGCSIKSVYDDARESYGEALSIAGRVLNNGLQKISWAIDTTRSSESIRTKEHDWILWGNPKEGTPFVVFNPHSWASTKSIEVPQQVEKIEDSQGQVFDFQPYRAEYDIGGKRFGSLFRAEIPPLGYKLFWIFKSAEEKQVKGKPSQDNNSKNILENNKVRVEFDEKTGYLTSYRIKEKNLELILGEGSIPLVIDISEYDTWGHGAVEFRKEIGRFTQGQIILIEEGPVRQKIRVVQRWGDSVIRQDFSLAQNSYEIEVQVQLDWQEKHKLCKLSYPVNSICDRSFSEIPYGTIERDTTGEEEPCQRWTACISEETHTGLALVNRGKYSYDCKGSDIRMTLANSSLYADHFGDRDDLGEYLDQGLQQFSYALFPLLDNKWRSKLSKKAEELNSDVQFVIETYHKGHLPRESQYIQISVDNVILSALKRSEDNRGYVLRLYECGGVQTTALVKFKLLDRTWQGHFSAHEIKTILFSDDNTQEGMEINFIENLKI